MRRKLDRSSILRLWAAPERPTVREIAARLGLAHGTVCNLILRARDAGDLRAAQRRPSLNRSKMGF
jgi:DNA-binding transcriptional regulator LsrR (DeoR family)